MTNRDMLSLVQRQLAIDLSCAVADLNREKDSLVLLRQRRTLDEFLSRDARSISTC